MEQHALVAASIPGKHPPTLPTLSAEERSQLFLQVKSLSEVLQPARERGTELEQAIMAMFAVMNVWTADRPNARYRWRSGATTSKISRCTPYAAPASGLWCRRTSCRASQPSSPMSGSRSGAATGAAETVGAAHAVTGLLPRAASNAACCCSSVMSCRSGAVPMCFSTKASWLSSSAQTNSRAWAITALLMALTTTFS